MHLSFVPCHIYTYASLFIFSSAKKFIEKIEKKSKKRQVQNEEPKEEDSKKFRATITEELK